MICPASHVTPYQLQGERLLIQCSFFFRVSPAVVVYKATNASHSELGICLLSVQDVYDLVSQAVSLGSDANRFSSWAPACSLGDAGCAFSVVDCVVSCTHGVTGVGVFKLKNPIAPTRTQIQKRRRPWRACMCEKQKIK